MRRMTTTKNRYQQMLRTYLLRREEMKLKYNGPVYKAKVANIANKISNIRRAIKAIEATESKLHSIDNMLKDFIGLSVFHIGNRKKVNGIDAIIAKNIFYRHALESGVAGSHVARFCDLKRLRHPTTQRRAFIRSFETNHYNRAMWYRWAAFVKAYNSQEYKIAA